MLADSPFRWDEAEADATKALELSPQNLKALFRRGKARKELGKWDQARAGKDSSVVLKVSSLSLKADQVVRHSDGH
jgi:tetratricopeptide (TPR) repeat protein